MARRAAPDDVADRAEAGHRPIRRRRGVRQRRRHRAHARRALPADRRRHPRHQSQGVERVEGEAARGPVPCDARAASPARTRRARCRQPAGAAGARRSACCGCTRSETRRALWRSSTTCTSSATRRGDRLARAAALLPRDEAQPVVKRGCPRPAQACRCWSTCPTRRSCSRASAASSGARPVDPGSQDPHDAHGYALDTFAVHDPDESDASHRDTIQYVEYELREALLRRARRSSRRRGARERQSAPFPAVAGSAASFPTTRARITSSSRRRRPPGAARADHRARARRMPTSTCTARRSTRWASAPRTCS